MGARSCLESSWRISHFGIKPERGGRPPRDSRTRGVRAVSAGAFVQEALSMLMLVELFNLNTRNVENVMVMYINRVRRVKVGEY